jgi:RNA polymerase sigma-70 factor, ECF subfamily
VIARGNSNLKRGDDQNQNLNATSENQSEGTDLDRLIRASVKGDVDAFGEIYQLYADNIYRYFFYRVRSDTEAQDLSSQVFLNAWKAIGRYKHENVPFLVWLYTISRNLLVNHNRSLRQHAELEEHVPDSSEMSNPISLLLRQTEREELVGAFEKLTAEQQQVLYYRFVENWSHTDVARVMSKSEGAIRAIQFRALESLRRLLGTNAQEVNLGNFDS